MDQEQVRRALDTILESPEFRDSHRYRELLQYLVEESIAGRTPKESTIGTEIFGKDPSFNSKEDATVRVYINNLRRKLEHYYLTSSTQFTHKLTIPVGHYKVEFTPTDEKPKNKNGKRRAILVGISLAAVLTSFALGYLSGRSVGPERGRPSGPNVIWNDFLKPEARPTLIVLGDYFFLRERTQVSAYYRRVTINSDEDFQRLIAQDPGFAKRYEVNNFTFLRPSALHGLTQILPILQESTNGYSTKLASQFTMADFKSNNVIFIGPFKTLFNFQKFLHTLGIEYAIEPSSVTIRNPETDSLQMFSIGDQRSGSYEKDYSIIAKGSGPEGSIILLLLGFAETGTIEATTAACDSLLFKAVGLKYPLYSFADPHFFTLVIGTEGISQAIFNADVRYFMQNKPLLNLSRTSREDSSRIR
ncbi:MAG TPA: hypothetical protein DEP53_11640 [Bacteroidetes bacterium]|nr:MAG: hypothetical protein A2X66_01895 [Ignavibacteria bacterium GWA2_54_16]HCA80372.1 hypothetical protein [Bacteroidota bacterium]